MLMLYMYQFVGFSRIVFAIDAGLVLLLVVGSRLLITSFDEYLRTRRSAGRQVLIWEAATYRLRRTLEGHTDAVRSVAFAPDGTTLASAGADRTVRLWDASAGTALAALAASTKPVDCVAFSPDTSVLASAGEDAQIHLWQVASRQRLLTLQGHAKRVRTVAFSPDKRTLASGSSRAWSCSTFRATARPRCGS